MTGEPPPPSERRSRPGAAARRRALGLGDGDVAAVEGDARPEAATPPSGGPSPRPPAATPAGPSAPTGRAAPPGAPAGPAPLARESLRDSLARIPDLVPDVPAEVQVARAPRSLTDSGLGAKVAATRSATPPSGRAGAVVGDVVPPPAGADAPAASRTGSVPGPQGGSPAPGAVGAVATNAAAAPVASPPPSAPAASVKGRLTTSETELPVLEARAALQAAPWGATEGLATPHPAVVAEAPPKAMASPRSHGRTAPPPPPALWRRIGFALAVLALVAAIPVLGYKGYHLVSNSKDGTFSSTVTNRSDPGYEAQVDPTPTAVVIQYDANHEPVSDTFLTLGNSAGGGGVIFVPVTTEVAKPALGVASLKGSYDAVKSMPEHARDQLATETGKLFNAGVGEVIELDDASWAQLVAPVAPLKIDNPEPVDIGGGVTIPDGQTTLTAAQVGPYLATRKPDESDLARLDRSQVVWQAWLDQIHTSTAAAPVPGETGSGIGRFALALSKGNVTYDTMPVDPIPGDTSGRYRVRKADVNDLVTDLVPSPTAASPGSRFTVKLLDGVSAGSVPADLTRQIVHLGGTVTVLGNGNRFGTAKTSVVYADPAKAGLARLVLAALGGTGKAQLDRNAPDTIDLTVLLGKDVLGSAATITTPSVGDTIVGSTQATTATDPTDSTVAGATPTTVGFTTTSGGT